MSFKALKIFNSLIYLLLKNLKKFLNFKLTQKKLFKEQLSKIRCQMKLFSNLGF